MIQPFIKNGKVYKSRVIRTCDSCGDVAPAHMNRFDIALGKPSPVKEEIFFFEMPTDNKKYVIRFLEDPFPIQRHWTKCECSRSHVSAGRAMTVTCPVCKRTYIQS